MNFTAGLSTINIKILSLPIEITTNHRPFLKEFCDFTSALALPANGEPPAVRFRVMQKRKYTHMEKDGRTIHRLEKDYQLCPMLLDQIKASCCEQVGEHLLFHSGAVVKNGRAILVPGQSNSGKTTLTLGLMNHGYKYLTDEVSAIHCGSLEVVPYQRPIFVDTWSPPLRREVIGAFRVYRYRGKGSDGIWGRWQYIVPQDGAVMPKDAQWKVDRIIFPRYAPRSKVALKPLGAAEAVMALMQRCWNPQLFPDMGLKICAGLVRRARCYTLEMGNLDKACGLIEDLQGQSR